MSRTGPVGDDDDIADDDDIVADPVQDPEDLVGAVFETDPTSGTFVQPPAIGPLIQGRVSEIALPCDLLPGSSFTPGTRPGLLFLFAMGEADPGGAQDLCQVTTSPSRSDAATFDNPHFESQLDLMQLPVQGAPITVSEGQMTGTHAPDGQSISNGTLAGPVDSRPLVPLLDEEGDEDRVCELVADTVGVSWVPCPDGPSPCLPLEVVDPGRTAGRRARSSSATAPTCRPTRRVSPPGTTGTATGTAATTSAPDCAAQRPLPGLHDARAMALGRRNERPFTPRPLHRG